MKKYILAPFLLFIVAGFVAAAQDNSPAAVAARLAAQRAAENGGGQAGPAKAADTGATNTADADMANTADTGAANGADAALASTPNTGATNIADNDPEEIARKARLAKAAKEAQAAANLPGSLALLQIITQRNIFDPRRQPWTGNTPQPVPVRVETWTLRGTSEIKGKGYVAFFEGDGVPSYPATRCVGDSLNGFKIKDITDTSVTLIDQSTHNAELVLEPPGKGQQGLTRNDGGPWKPAYYTPEYFVATRGPRQADAGMGPGQQFPPVPTMMVDNNPVAFTFGGNVQDDNSGGFGGPGRNRQRGGGGGPGGGGRAGRQPGGGGGGFGGAGGGGFGAGGFGGGGGGNPNTAFAPPTVVDPNAPIDPAVLARLQQRRQQEQ